MNIFFAPTPDSEILTKPLLSLEKNCTFINLYCHYVQHEIALKKLQIRQKKKEKKNDTGLEYMCRFTQIIKFEIREN